MVSPSFWACGSSVRISPWLAQWKGFAWDDSGRNRAAAIAVARIVRRMSLPYIMLDEANIETCGHGVNHVFIPRDGRHVPSRRPRLFTEPRLSLHAAPWPTSLSPLR